MKRKGGYNKIKKKELDKLTKEFPQETIDNPTFISIYKMVSDNKTGAVMMIWTWVVGIATIVSTVFSIVNSF